MSDWEEKAKTIKPRVSHYVDDNDLIDDFCSQMKCNLCHGTDQNGEPNGYGCPSMEEFQDKYDDYILEYDEAYDLVKKERDELKDDLKSSIDENARLKSLLIEACELVDVSADFEDASYIFNDFLNKPEIKSLLETRANSTKVLMEERE